MKVELSSIAIDFSDCSTKIYDVKLCQVEECQASEYDKLLFEVSNSCKEDGYCYSSPFLTYLHNLLTISHWSLVIGHWSLVIGHWSLVISHWSLVISH
ncbi:hypothetical protein A6S26_21370 [Nostoc sp. ATCC 43529]|nr:hypothetical protein A6S26_21370 [Nostoc sp. ATCC 43529]